jgi:integrase
LPTPKTLTDAAARSAKLREKSYKLGAGGGLYLLVNPNGSKWWRFKYRLFGREKLLSFGVYPEVPLKEARERRDEARKLVKKHHDPSVERQTARRVGEDNFEAVAREWYAKHSPSWVEAHSGKILRRLERRVFPYLGKQPVGEIGAPSLLAVMRRIEHSGKVETAHRVLQSCGRIFRYAIATGRAQRDPSADLKGALPPKQGKHLATIVDPKKIGELLRAIDGYEGSPTTQAALKLAPLTFVRPGELRAAEWAEFRLEDAEWRIPAERMKMKAPHIVPLSKQALAVLEELQRHTGSGRLLFPGLANRSRHMSANTVNGALRRLGYTAEEMTGHGFRSMASTLLNEQGWHRDAIERQLAHGERDAVRAAYNYAEHLPERRKMMQKWADYLDGLRKANEKVVGIRSSK